MFPQPHGSFAEKRAVLETSVSTLGGTAVVAWYVGDKPGTAKVTARSDGAEATVDVAILEKAEEPLTPDKPEDAGPDEDGESVPFEIPPPPDIPFEIPPPPDGFPGDNAEPATILKLKWNISKTSISAGGVDTSELKLEIEDPPLSPAQKGKLVFHFQTTRGTLLDPKTKQPLKEVEGKSGIYAVRSGSNGFFTVLLRSSVAAGKAEINATLVEPSNYTGTASTVVDFVAAGVIEFVKATPTIIGTRGSGREIATVSFLVKDTDQKPFPQGTSVYFKISQSLGGATVTKSSNTTDAKGMVTTQIRSGGTVGTVTVNARVEIPTPPNRSCPAQCTKDTECGGCGLVCNHVTKKCAKMLEAESSSIAIVGGRPNYKHMTFSCEKDNIGALYGMTGQNVRAIINTKCSVQLGDRFSNKVGFSTQVLFMIEAGTIDSTAQTAPFTPGGGTENVGIALTYMRTQNPPPVDVLPMSVPNKRNCKNAACDAPDPSVLSSNPFAWKGYDCTGNTKDFEPNNQKVIRLEPYYFDATQNRTRNPRDGLVTVVAYTTGEEEFGDDNENGKYDLGEPFTDLGEPYLDVNDNGKYDSKLDGLPRGERFVDLPCSQDDVANARNGCTKVGVGNGRYDGPNGRWDSNTLIWKKTWVVWSGCAKLITPNLINSPVEIAAKNCKQLKFNSGIFPRTSFSITPSRSAKYNITIHDENLNPLTANSEVTYTGKEITVIKSPDTDKTHGPNGLGFKVVTLKDIDPKTGITRVLDHIFPSSFWGLSGISHKVTLEDSDGQENDKKTARLDIKVTSRTAATSGRLCSFLPACQRRHSIIGRLLFFIIRTNTRKKKKR